jgi:hypothetical protein
MPRALHAQLAARADDAGSSLNQYIVETLTHALDGDHEPVDAREPRRVPRSLRLSLIANALVVALAAATCVVLLAFGWR